MENVKIIDILGADDTELTRISKEGILSLNLEEMHAIMDYFRKAARNPTDVELETLAQTWSEHCVHKTFRGIIEYQEQSTVHGPRSTEKRRTTNDLRRTTIIDNLLKQTVMKATKELDKKWCISVFKDNAGIIEFDRDNAVAFKIETHNHPSALEPYGGAGTGIGGVIRDILGVGLGAKPIMNTDIFCFGFPDLPHEKLPGGVLHPKRICKGVVAGVRDYGNRMGIPTANGAVIFDNGFVCNPLVYCGTVGIMPKDKCFKETKPGDLIVAVGGRTGRDGIHGATFSSVELAKDTEVSAVQIGNPIVEKKATDVILQARDKNLYNAITDCGAGGFSSAVGEMGKDIGARVYLERAPLKYAGLTPWEIWVSEAQERMVLAVPPHKLDEIMAVFKAENVEATVLGEFTNDKKLVLLYKGEKVCELEMDFLHDGVPRFRRKAVWDAPETRPPRLCRGEVSLRRGVGAENPEQILKKILSHPTVASKEWIIRQYDHEVQAGTVLKPLQGKENDGPGDACVIKPLFRSNRGIVISNGINPSYGKLDPYWMAASAIDEALRNNICAGGSLEKCALLDNFCWGSPEKPGQLAGLVRASQACYDMAKAYGTPFISGKDSLNNEYFDQDSGKKISIPPTLLISAISVIPDIGKVVSMDLKSPGNLIYLLGETYDELGGSIYYSVNGLNGGMVPKVNPGKAAVMMKKLQKAIREGIVRSCHDCSEGGLAVAAAEMAFAGGLGAEIQCQRVNVSRPASVGGQATCQSLRNDMILFSESNSRFLAEVKPKNRRKFEKIMNGNKSPLTPLSKGGNGGIYSVIGKVKKDKRFKVYGLNGKLIINADIYELKEAWQKTLRW
ncbi:phosphoribosylformylglycinamidine synthase subunit PurL [Candidatus Desantisbacteria bacterium CG_4_10_14_0_8_um_filter_48_22]|uniref:Phosphoribosylformylglycinamidine synthase subunit PurL n=1 Tax=Candidatus Desantisbacteria bacterium CG_4_10_14_0_8_um_filter_48_22 TaxID=1974543 RepID=A0A2M7SBB9_9BACT|nr:MAG: phosphoribosylformylglycinamidine synthase II [Candidatus Desantisbacteria bacterium CG1_02_49_89]PIV54196.1 MAG: phosphoribosylformylglycinamidine synthase subunit PurL [Candidatus Desantisbacteria bacterium CG02_land_8_20_14_3_00_49_13]PIZ16815.1 MAG: phosphoribosylformylglycinamidine synthase subunit PurL [Candidatus Desantisbacteria bacterium CG_4_10_14_0_8_um_filter_48_22]PJB27380.1 MAG: phosphoribosylformylglycinamidine synthase subunit PurL [Candidatus Desantisbacteria bacterium C